MALATLTTDRAVIVPAPSPDLGTLLDAILRRGDSPHTRRAYAQDLAAYRDYLASAGIAWDAVTPADLDAYRDTLRERYATATVNRRTGTVRALYALAHEEGLLLRDPARRLRTVKGRDDRDGGALTRTEARTLLESVAADAKRPGRELLGLRDLALLGLMLRTGLRRSEVVGLRVGDLGTAQGHAVATVRGKGNVTRTAKLPPDLRRTLQAWQDAAGLTDPEAPVFVEVGVTGRIAASPHALSTEGLYRIVRRRLAAAGLPVLSPHALRASFVTLALEGGAPLHLVQHAAGHADAKTTYRYWRRKANLDDAATDYLHL